MALLRDYCHDKTNTETVLKAIESACTLLKQNSTAQLFVPYEDIEECSEIVFAKIFAYELFQGETENNLAEAFCRRHENGGGDDYIEAYFRALNVIGKVPGICDFSVSLSMIMERGLGGCVQNCKLNNVTDMRLSIEDDLSTEEYPSEEIEKALRWLNDDNAVSVSYQYYTFDLAPAFGNVNEDFVCFLFDDEKVILNSKSASNSMLKFVQKRYRGKDASFGELIRIISEQNELKGEWRKSERQYIEKLSKFRKDTWQKQEVLFPDYDRHLNDANPKAIEYVLPELLQNINDCKAAPEQTERILIVDVNVSNGMMMLQYDEAGFDYSNVYSITAIGQSSKHDESEGEKGLGFKKVFTLFEEVEIYSNKFSFSLTADANTIPKWIADVEKQKRYMISGKTTMLFRVKQVCKDRLAGIRSSWKALMDGEYAGNLISPLFLENISEIHLKGHDNYYSRKRMLQEFYHLKVSLTSFYTDGLRIDAQEKKTLEKDIREKLQTRKKCKLMEQKEKDSYIDSLSIDICIPKTASKFRGKGCIYSTLPTEKALYSSLFVNAPLELTTGRDGILENSIFNNTIMKMLFTADPKRPSILGRLLQILVAENTDVFILDYFGSDIEKFVNNICALAELERDSVLAVFEDSAIFMAYDSEKQVKLSDAYGVDVILCQYINSVKACKNNIHSWMEKRTGKVRNYHLIVPKTKEQCEKLEKYATLFEKEKGYFPLEENGIDLPVEYLKDEYGYVGGEV